MSTRKKPAKRRTEKPVSERIFRAAARAGITRPEQVQSYEEYLKSDHGAKFEELIRATGHSDSEYVSEQLRLIARQVADRAFSLHCHGIGVDTDTRSISGIREGLIRVCDRLSETLAILGVCDSDDGLRLARSDGFLDGKILAALREAWELRWELGSGSEEIREVRGPLAEVGS